MKVFILYKHGKWEQQQKVKAASHLKRHPGYRFAMYRNNILLIEEDAEEYYKKVLAGILNTVKAERELELTSYWENASKEMRQNKNRQLIWIAIIAFVVISLVFSGHIILNKSLSSLDFVNY